jgi:NADH dehydrogenase
MQDDLKTPEGTLGRSSSSGYAVHQHVAGNYDATVDYGMLLGDGIKLVVDTAVRCETANRPVALASAPALPYDCVIYAVGRTGGAPSLVPGVAESPIP